MPQIFQSKGVALVTGVAQDIGRVIALRLADDGFDLALNDIPSKLDLIDVLSQEIKGKSRRTCTALADVSVEAEVQQMISVTVGVLGSLDITVANAGIVRAGSLLTTSSEDFETTIQVNARGTFLCYKYAAMQMILQGRGGRITGASSMAGTYTGRSQLLGIQCEQVRRERIDSICSNGARSPLHHRERVCSWTH
ncbi:hypothetical protein BJ138DRAFT_499007 [Hygrophoropsis aurantiaca]|uniref:Uncharacterized protein n=1 Tax=Hygrophoropsis aurantiaca TaxID=72124 RepID=A0ACB8A271_9AGAM|nr:hypothetical protein BJ138DRAFT_499007 [Hygrophoropsis aurantiaca]